MGYRAAPHKITLATNQHLDFKLAPSGNDLSEVVAGRASQANISRAQAGAKRSTSSR